jgi:hypothetical protein
MNRYLFEYRFRGEEWALEIMAESREEAIARVQALPWAQYKGEIQLTVPVVTPSIWAKVAFASCFAVGAVFAFLVAFIWK